jgi:hypothetical protein
MAFFDLVPFSLSFMGLELCLVARVMVSARKAVVGKGNL